VLFASDLVDGAVLALRSLHRVPRVTLELVDAAKGEANHDSGHLAGITVRDYGTIREMMDSTVDPAADRCPGSGSVTSTTQGFLLSRKNATERPNAWDWAGVDAMPVTLMESMTGSS